MSRIICAIIWCVVVLVPSFVAAETVKNFAVNGNSRLDKEAIIRYLPFSIGDNPDIQQIDSGVKALLASDLFSNVQITSDGVGNYLIDVVENPIIAKLYFDGNDRYDDDTLRSEVLLKEGAMMTDARVKASMLRLQDLYKRAGRYSTEVVPKIVKKPDNRVDFVFEIEEGEVVYIEDISIIGNRAFSDSRLRGIIDTKEDHWWRFFSSDSTFDEDRLAVDKSKLVEFYEEKGFADFIVESATATLTADKEAFIIKFVVNEGRRYQIRNVNIDDRLTDIELDDINEHVDQENEDYYNKKSVRKNEEDLVLFLSEQGYPFVDVRGEIERVGDTELDLTYVISESAPAYVERIDISGNVRTLDDVIRRKLSIVEGDPLNRSLLERSERDLRGTGFFSKVDLIERPGSEAGSVDMRVDVEEQSTGDITFGVGVSTIDNLLGEISLTERNFLGRGQYVRVGALLSGRRQEIDFGFTEPYLLDRDLSGGFDIYHTTTDLRQEASYDESNTGFVLRSGFLAAEDLSLRPRYKINYGEINNLNDQASAIVRDTADRGALISSSVGYEAIYDQRDDFIFPTEGYLLRVNQDLAGLGGDVKAFKTIASGKVFYTPLEKYTFSWELEGGAVFPFGGYDLRIIDRNLLGAASFRGFDIAGVGPRIVPSNPNENADAIGGTYFTILRSEVTVPLPGLDDFGMSGALFNDTGTIWNVDNIPSGVTNQNDVKDDANIRSSVGFGLNWTSPLGPIRLDFAYPVVKESFDREQVFRFSAGSQF
ncbi:MAG: outer membrane protein assembly factor BamA [Pseudomonadota bacterium]